MTGRWGHAWVNTGNTLPARQMKWGFGGKLFEHDWLAVVKHTRLSMSLTYDVNNCILADFREVLLSCCWSLARGKYYCQSDYKRYIPYIHYCCRCHAYRWSILNFYYKIKKSLEKVKLIRFLDFQLTSINASVISCHKLCYIRVLEKRLKKSGINKSTKRSCIPLFSLSF